MVYEKSAASVQTDKDGKRSTDPYTLVVKLLTNLRLQFSHLNKYKFKHGFSDTINAMCVCKIYIHIQYLYVLCSIHSKRLT